MYASSIFCNAHTPVHQPSPPNANIFLRHWCTCTLYLRGGGCWACEELLPMLYNGHTPTVLHSVSLERYRPGNKPIAWSLVLEEREKERKRKKETERGNQRGNQKGGLPQETAAALYLTVHQPDSDMCSTSTTLPSSQESSSSLVAIWVLVTVCGMGVAITMSQHSLSMSLQTIEDCLLSSSVAGTHPSPWSQLMNHQPGKEKELVREWMMDDLNKQADG